MFKTINSRVGADAPAPLSANVDGTADNDFLEGSMDADRIRGFDGDDYLIGYGGADNLLGGDGNDNMYGDGEFNPSGSDGADQLDGGLGADFMYGGGGADTLLGGAGDDFLQGGFGSGRFAEDGKDLLKGGNGFDYLAGDGGNDTLLGEDGNDLLRGNLGNDMLDGGAGVDRAWFLMTAATEGVTFSAASFQGATQVVMRDGQGGKDTLVNMERIGVQGSQFNDKLTGSGYQDYIIANGGNDRVITGDGDDTLNGGAGDDQLTGGAGADTFQYFFSADYGRDTIKDLEAGDRIDLSNMDADTTTTDVNDAFVLVDAFTGEAGQLVVTYQAGKGRTLLQMDDDGDGAADVVIFLTGDQREFDNFVL